LRPTQSTARPSGFCRVAECSVYTTKMLNSAGMVPIFEKIPKIFIYFVSK
jgi:hypothetical protein